MKTSSLRSALFSLALPLAVGAQTAQTSTTPPASPPTSLSYEPAAGLLEFTVGGAGSSNKDFDSSSGGLNFSVGNYLNDSLLASIRQTVSYANPSGGGDDWGGSTFLALDQHFGTGALRPLIGVNAGRVYGENVRDSWAAGLETGVKFYVQPRTFIYLIGQYAWLFDDGDDFDDTFDDGQVLWTAGVGFNF